MAHYSKSDRRVRFGKAVSVPYTPTFGFQKPLKRLGTDREFVQTLPYNGSPSNTALVCAVIDISSNRFTIKVCSSHLTSFRLIK